MQDRNTAYRVELNLAGYCVYVDLLSPNQHCRGTT